MDPTTQSQRPLIIGSRASKLAIIQAEIVENALKVAHPSQPFELKLMTSEGDRNQSQALYLIGGKALWTKDLEVELINGSIDLIVHSLKDMPTSLPDGCELSAITEREDPRDTLVVKSGLTYTTLEEMPPGSVIGTSSVRRVAQLKKSFPHLTFKDVRGNLNTRLAKLDAEDGPYTALVLAAAGLERLGFKNRITAYISPPILYPAVGQAALGVESRTGDSRVAKIVSVLNHRQTQWQCLAERACLRVLEGGCSVPVGVWCTLTGDKNDEDEDKQLRLKMTGTVTSLDGQTHVAATIEEGVRSADDAEAVGRKLAAQLKASGAGVILEEIKKDREAKQQTSSDSATGTAPSQ